MELKLLKYPHPMLKSVARPLRGDEIHENFVDKNSNVPTCVLSELVAAMLMLMKKSNGVGLAAPQVGYPVQLVIVGGLVMINPRIRQRKGQRIPDVEGCLSLPGMRGYVMRNRKVSVDYLNLGGFNDSIDFVDEAARCAQHEIDHLNGVLISDIMAMSDREKYRPWLMLLEKEFNSKEVAVAVDTIHTSAAANSIVTV